MNNANQSNLNVEIPDSLIELISDILSDRVFEKWMSCKRQAELVSSEKGDTHESQN